MNSPVLPIVPGRVQQRLGLRLEQKLVVVPFNRQILNLPPEHLVQDQQLNLYRLYQRPYRQVKNITSEQGVKPLNSKSRFPHWCQNRHTNSNRNNSGNFHLVVRHHSSRRKPLSNQNRTDGRKTPQAMAETVEKDAPQATQLQRFCTRLKKQRDRRKRKVTWPKERNFAVDIEWEGCCS